MVQITNFYYEPSSSIVAQGRGSVIRKYEKQGYYVKSGSNGSYRMIKPSITQITFITETGEEHTQSVKQLIRNYYNISRVTKDIFYVFLYSCLTGSIDLKYSSDRGLYI